MANDSAPIHLILHRKSCNKPEVRAAVRSIQDAGIDLTVRIPWRGRDLRTFVKEAIKGGATRIIAGGGDGTINKVVNALMRKDYANRASLGILPLGTANDFARGAGLPLDDPAEALRIATEGPASRIDIGVMNGRHFVNVASAGFGAEITATTPKEMKQMLGGAAYSIFGLIKAREMKPYTGRLIQPDGTVEEGSMLFMAVGNSRYAGGGYDVAPKASLTDGMLDVAFVSGPTRESMEALVDDLMQSKDVPERFLNYRQLASFVIESDRPMHMNLDGEPVLDTRFVFEARPKSIDVVLGARPESGM